MSIGSGPMFVDSQFFWLLQRDCRLAGLYHSGTRLLLGLPPPDTDAEQGVGVVDTLIRKTLHFQGNLLLDSTLWACFPGPRYASTGFPKSDRDLLGGWSAKGGDQSALKIRTCKELWFVPSELQKVTACWEGERRLCTWKNWMDAVLNLFQDIVEEVFEAHFEQGEADSPEFV